MSMQQPFREREREGGQQRPQEDWQQGDQRMSPKETGSLCSGSRAKTSAKGGSRPPPSL